MCPLEKLIAMTQQLAEARITGTQESFKPPVVVLMGSFNTGKSTIINNFLEEIISPVDTLPTTSVLYYLKYGEKFTARAHGRGKTLCFTSKEQLKTFLKSRNAATFEKVEVTLKHNFLKQCVLVDTPGIDASTDTNTQWIKAISKMDKIIYLFHQRGIDNTNKQFISKLAKKHKIRHNNISFWINCNLGKSDGTSLQKTGQVLQNIFGWRPRINLIDSFNSESIKMLRLFLEVNLSKDIANCIDKTHKKADEKIPARLQKSMLLQDDAAFLEKIWKIKKEADKILIARNILNNLPLVESTLKQLLSKNKNMNLKNDNNLFKRQINQKQPLGIVEIKEKMIELGTKIKSDNMLSSTISARDIGKWLGALRKEKFKIVTVGGFSSGKSTFLNALMGEHILPAENRPTTACITNIEYGAKKKAIVEFNARQNLKLYSYDEYNNIRLNRNELITLEHWLSGDTEYRRLLEISLDNGNGFKKVSREQLYEEIKRTKKLFAENRTGNLDYHGASTLFRPVKSWKAIINNPIREVNLTFATIPSLVFDLTSEKSKELYKRITTSYEALRINNILITHPAEFLKMATFVDTPGLDSTIQKHSELTTDYIRHSDAYLFFLNGKHILTKSDYLSLVAMLKLRLQGYLSSGGINKATKEISKFFFVINFSDTLTPAEKQKVKNFLQKKLLFKIQDKTISISEEQIAMISSLYALEGKDAASFRNLLCSLRKNIWNYRGKQNLKKSLNDLKFALEKTNCRQPIIISNSFNYPCKFSVENNLRSCIEEINNEIKTLFAKVFNQINQFTKEYEFIAFARGNVPSTFINYYQFTNILNNRIEILLNKSQLELKNSLSSWLTATGIKQNYYPTIPPTPILNASVAIEKMDWEINRKRNFYGALKIKECRHEIMLILEEQKVNLIKELHLWKYNMEKNLRDLISPVLLKAAAGYLYDNQKKYSFNNNLSTKQLQVINNYLAEVKRIEQIINTPGGM